MPSANSGTWAPPADVLMTALTDLRPPSNATRPTGAPSWVMMWTLAGAGVVEQGGAEIRAEPGTLVILGARGGHRYGVDSSARHWVNWWAHFQPRAPWLSGLRPFQVAPRAYRVGPVAAAARPAVLDAWRRLHAYLRWPGDGELPPQPAQDATSARPVVATDRRVRALGLTTLEEILTLATFAAGSTSDQRADVDARLRRVLAHIAADPGAAYTVHSLARVAALSPSRLSHLFRAQVGRSPMRAVRAARLAHAARLLDATDLSVTQVAHAAGFASPFHFSRVFAAEWGTAPSRYRAAGTGRQSAARGMARGE